LLSGVKLPSEKLPEEFAPTGPKLSKFPIQPAPPLQPRLFPDEARFALRLAVLAGGAELAAWAWLAHLDRRSVVALAALRLLRPLWAWLGMRVPRPAVALALLGGALLADARGVGAVAGLAALGDLCASCIGDSVTVERRAAAYAWLDMGQALGAVLGLAIAAVLPQFVPHAAAAALIVAAVGVRDLRDRGTPRSAWPGRAYLSALLAPLAWQLCGFAFLVGFAGARLSPGWIGALALIAGMALAARLEPRMPNAILFSRLAAVMALVAWALGFAPLASFSLGAMFAAIPAAVARGAGEMERPLVSSLAWSALFAGAALAAVI